MFIACLYVLRHTLACYGINVFFGFEATVGPGKKHYRLNPKLETVGISCRQVLDFEDKHGFGGLGSEVRQQMPEVD